MIYILAAKNYVRTKITLSFNLNRSFRRSTDSSQ